MFPHESSACALRASASRFVLHLFVIQNWSLTMNYRLLRAGYAVLSFYGAAVSLGLCFLYGTVLAAEPPDTQLTLSEAFTLTLEANPELDIYRFREAAIAGMRTTAGLRPPLQVNGGVEDALGTGAVRGVDAAEFTLSLSQVIELGEQRDARVG